jgi:hypothetical protein
MLRGIIQYFFPDVNLREDVARGLAEVTLTEFDPVISRGWTVQDVQLPEELIEGRRTIAAAENKPEIAIVATQTLQEIVRKKPVNRHDLADVEGMAELTTTKYGEQILEVVMTHFQALTSGEQASSVAKPIVQAAAVSKRRTASQKEGTELPALPLVLRPYLLDFRRRLREHQRQGR